MTTFDKNSTSASVVFEVGFLLLILFYVVICQFANIEEMLGRN
tara:strand:+ start:96478 stop:96606 length:129 start_codon:yes stop_codon:yes gene_type:complete